MDLSIIPNVKAYVENMLLLRASMPKPKGMVFNSYEELLIKMGVPLVQKSKKLPQKIKKMEAKMCFRNSFHMMQSHHLIYCEGLAFSGLIVTMHAWNIDEAGNVIDVTWRSKDFPKEYLGIPFNPKFVNKTAQNRGWYGIIENWEQDFPLLSGKENPDEYLHPEFKEHILTREPISAGPTEEVMAAWKAIKELA